MTSALPIPVKWFGTPPQADGGGRNDNSFAMALWRLDRDDRLELRTEAMPNTHMVCAHLDGSINGWRARLDGRSYARSGLPGTSCMLRAGEAGEVSLSDAHASTLHFYLPDAWFAGSLEEFAPGQRMDAFELLDPMNVRTPAIARCAAAAARALREGGQAAQLEIEAAGLQLAAALIRHHSNAAHRAPGPAHRGGLAPWRLWQALDLLEASLSRNLSLSELAAAAGLSEGHFSRAFRAATGEAPYAYARRRRVELARDLLLTQPELSVAEVAFACGFADQAHLTTVFRSETGLPPAAWRRAQLR